MVGDKYRSVRLSNESNRNSLEKGMMHTQEMYKLLEKTLKPKLTADSSVDEVILNIKAIEHVICDVRRPSDRKKNTEIKSADEVSTLYLGFSRDDILSMAHSELLEKIESEHPMRGENP